MGIALVIILGCGLAFELVMSGAAGPLDSATLRRAYRGTWWLTPASVAAAGGYAALRGLPTLASSLAAPAAAGAALSAALLRPVQAASDAPRFIRKGITRDRNRPRRLLALAGCASVVVLATVFG